MLLNSIAGQQALVNEPRPKAKLLPSPFQNQPKQFDLVLNVTQTSQSDLPPWYSGESFPKTWNNYIPQTATNTFKQYQIKPQQNNTFRKSGQNANSRQFYCDICDRSFSDSVQLNIHASEHIQCSIDGCKFKAHPKVVALHRKHQHETGFAKRIMSLDDPEDIKKWREERKRNFPTAENTKKKKAEDLEKSQRGELLETKNFGKMGRGKQRRYGSKPYEDKSDNFDSEGNQQNYRGRGRGRWNRFQRGRGRGRGIVRGGQNKSFKNQNNDQYKPSETSQQRKSVDNNGRNKNELEAITIMKPFTGIFDSNDEEMEITNSNNFESSNELNSTTEYIHCKESIPIDKAIIEEMDKNIKTDEDVCENNNNNYNVSVLQPTVKKEVIELELEDVEDSFKESIVLNIIQEIDKIEEFIENTPENILETSKLFVDSSIDDSDDEPPIIQSSKLLSPSLTVPNVAGALGSIMQNYGSDSDSDDKPPEVDSKNNDSKSPIRKRPVPNLYPISRRKLTLLEKLLANEIRQERNMILQCAHYIVKNNFFNVNE